MLSQALQHHPLLALLMLFGAGVLTSLTPCIYPMIPITAAVVGGRSVGATQSRARTAALTFTYVLGLALVYSVLGLVAGMTRTIFGTVSSNPWLYFAMANLLIVAGLAMLDVLPLQLPSWIVQRAATAGSGGGLGGAFAIGAM